MALKINIATKKLAQKQLQKQFKLSPTTAGMIVFVVLLVGGLIGSFAVNNVPLDSKTKAPITEGIWDVVRVVDGDTIIVGDAEDKAQQYRIRFIGADTPEVVKPNTPTEPFGPEASEFTKRKIAEANNTVRLAFDGEQVDRYNRTLAMVYLTMPDGKEIWLNELLIREGLARAQTQYRYSKGAKDAFRQAEAEAKEAKRNLWGL
ncbi:MAG: thermonuclease family protein [Planctomycetaceae bacterium]|nr:thermonuclease family protein [Planctomycetaceae bacterium]